MKITSKLHLKDNVIQYEILVQRRADIPVL